MTDLDKLDALAAAATPGPWTEHGRDVDHDKMVAAGRNPGDACGLGCEVEGPPEATLRGQFDRHADAAFIAACDPATIRDLVAAARAGEEVLRQSEPDDDFDGQYVDFLVPADAIEALRAALHREAEA